MCNYFTLNFLIDKGLLREEWDLWGCIMDDHQDTMHFLLEKYILPTDDDVDSAIAAGCKVFDAREYRCRPTPEAYMLTFEKLYCDCHYLVHLNWLYDDMHCSLGFILLEEMQNDPTGSNILERCSSTIKDWFEERLC